MFVERPGARGNVRRRHTAAVENRGKGVAPYPARTRRVCVCIAFQIGARSKSERETGKFNESMKTYYLSSGDYGT